MFPIESSFLQTDWLLIPFALVATEFDGLYRDLYFLKL